MVPAINLCLRAPIRYSLSSCAGACESGVRERVSVRQRASEQNQVRTRVGKLAAASDALASISIRPQAEESASVQSAAAIDAAVIDRIGVGGGVSPSVCSCCSRRSDKTEDVFRGSPGPTCPFLLPAISVCQPAHIIPHPHALRHRLRQLWTCRVVSFVSPCPQEEIWHAHAEV